MQVPAAQRRIDRDETDAYGARGRRAEAVRGRVAHVLLRFIEQSETFIPDTILELERQGWRGTVIAQQLVNREHFPYPPDGSIRLARRPPPRTLLLNRLLLRNLPQRQASWLLPQLAATAPDLVHAHFGHVAAAAAPAARRLGLPLIASFHGTDATSYPRHQRWARRSYRELFSTVECVIVPSRFLAGKLLDAGYLGRVEIVPAGLRLERLPFADARAPQPGEPARLLLVARQWPVKGTDVLLRALPAVAARVPEVRLDVIGYGEELEQNAALARRLGIAERVRFLGPRPHADTLAAIRAAHLVVVPSRRAPNGDEESSSLVAREALASGIQVVATRSGGIAENFPPEHRCELVPPGDPEALAARICELLRSTEQWPARAARARAWVQSQFDSRRMAERLAAIYEEALERRRRPSRGP